MMATLTKMTAYDTGWFFNHGVRIQMLGWSRRGSSGKETVGMEEEAGEKAVGLAGTVQRARPSPICRAWLTAKGLRRV